MHRVCLIGQRSSHPGVHGAGQRQMTTFPLAVLAPSRAAAAFTLSVPCVAGSHAAATAGLLHAEDLVCVQGKLCGRQHINKNGQEKNTLAVNVREVRVLQAAGVWRPPPRNGRSAGRRRARDRRGVWPDDTAETMRSCCMPMPSGCWQKRITQPGSNKQS